MMIRPERASDRADIAEVTAAAFADVAHSDQSEPRIIERLRDDGDLSLSLVAIVNDKLVGHVAFSAVAINGTSSNWLGLGPVSVKPKFQGGGIGAALIREGLDQLRSSAAGGCVVLGASAYYSRFGFAPDARLRYEGAPREYFMGLVLAASEVPEGLVSYAPAFG